MTGVSLHKAINLVKDLSQAYEFDSYQDMIANNDSIQFLDRKKISTGAGVWRITTAVQLNVIANTNPQLYAIPLNGLWVKDFGAEGDGVTDDTTALQTAANAAEGSTLVITSTPDYYLIDIAIVLSEGTTVQGEGYPLVKSLDSRYLDESFVANPFRTNGNNHITIRGMSAGPTGLIYFKDSSYGKVIDCIGNGHVNDGGTDYLGNRFVHQQGEGFYITTENCQVKNYHWHIAYENERIINPTGPAGNMQVLNCDFENEFINVPFLTQSFPVGVYGWTVGDIKVLGCSFKNIRSEGAGDGYGVYEGDSLAHSFAQTSFIVADCTFVDDNTVGVGQNPMIGITQRVSRTVSVDNCKFQYDSAAPGIAIFHLSETVVHAARTRSCRISNCEILNGTIAVAQTWKSVSITGCDIDNGNIRIGDGTANSILYGEWDNNKIYNSPTRCIWSRNVEYSVITNNKFFDPNQSGSGTLNERMGVLVDGDSTVSGVITNNYGINRVGKGGAMLSLIAFQNTIGTPDFNLNNNTGRNLLGTCYNFTKTGKFANAIISEGERLYPVDPALNEPLLSICDYSKSRNTTVNAVTSDTLINVTAGKGPEFLVNSNFGIELDDGTIHYSTVASFTANTVVINDGLPSDAASDNRVWSYRITDGAYAGGKQSYEGSPTATTNRDAMIAAGIMDAL